MTKVVLRGSRPRVPLRLNKEVAGGVRAVQGDSLRGGLQPRPMAISCRRGRHRDDEGGRGHDRDPRGLLLGPAGARGGDLRLRVAR
ncbi:hypothetical protein SDC9_58454 [bioreactor metagenome]|uniref:Uncharacterized protein n=1 Tax=bioreactor metagenome TaxID=1076179 RepID=A0A644XD34_9ZZZZ